MPSLPSEQRAPTDHIKCNSFATNFFKDFYNVALGLLWLPGTDLIAGGYSCPSILSSTRDLLPIEKM